jgi:hypothetical protein
MGGQTAREPESGGVQPAPAGEGAGHGATALPGPNGGADHVQFRYFGFFAVLRRYRSMTVTGWGVAAIGVLALVLSWGLPGGRGLLNIGLSCVLAAAGVLVVQAAVMGLHAYVSVPFPPVPPDLHDTDRLALEQIEPVITAVRDGGWEDAFHAIAEVKAIGERAGLPAPDRRGPITTQH